MKHVTFLFILLFSFLVPSLVYAEWGFSTGVKIITNPSVGTEDVSRTDIFNFMGDFYKDSLPNTYGYIDVKSVWISKNSELYESLQVLIYLDLIKNTSTNIYPDKKLKASDFYKLSDAVFAINLRGDQLESDLQNRYTKAYDLQNVATQLDSIINRTTLNTEESIAPTRQVKAKELELKKDIFTDVYETLLTDHYNKDSIDEVEVIESAIKGLANWTGDTYTTYFPPIENKSFQQSLNGEYEWIGSYVEMPAPGIVQIVSPIVWSPSEKAGIKWGDIITKIDDIYVTESMSLTEVVSYIKGPAGTTVDLTIQRNNSTILITVERAKITIKEIEYSLPRANTFYIQVKTFWAHVDDEFEDALDALKAESSVNKVIIDLRNNPGWYLSTVNDMLSYFIEKWEPTAIVKYQDGEVKHLSKWYNDIDFSEYQIVFLQNSGTASASEIMIGSVKDYYPDTIIIWEKSFWKGSVQDIKSYSDGSSLKYTIAKWFTGKTQTWIDGVGISPDIELELDEKKWERGIDNQLDKALQIR